MELSILVPVPELPNIIPAHPWADHKNWHTRTHIHTPSHLMVSFLWFLDALASLDFKRLHLHFKGKKLLLASSFEQMSYSHRFILQNYQMKSRGIITLMSDPLCGWRAELRRLQPQLHFIYLLNQFQLLLLCSDTSKNMIKFFFRVLRKKNCFA